MEKTTNKRKISIVYIDFHILPCYIIYTLLRKETMDRTNYKKYKITAICFLLVLSVILIGADTRRRNRQNPEITFFEKETEDETSENTFYDTEPENDTPENLLRKNFHTSTDPENLSYNNFSDFETDGESDEEKPKLININTATSEELQQLYRIGPALAERIIAYRNCYGVFETLEEIKEVEGIGDATYEKLKAWITVENH